MSTHEPPTAASVDAPSPAAATPERPAYAPKRRRPSVLGRAVFRLIVLGLVAFNAWWFVRDVRPLPEMKQVRAWINTREYEKAESALREHLRRAPNDADARIQLARSLASRDRLLDCAEELHKVPFWSPRKYEALFLEGNSYMVIDLARPAEAAWQACLVDDPLHPCPWDQFRGAVEALIELYALEQRWDDAHDVVWRMYDEVDPQDQENVLIMRLRMEVERIETEMALSKLRRMLAADPDDIQARCALAGYEQTAENTAEALRLLEIGLEQNPTHVDLWRTYLEVLKESGETSALAEAVAKLPPDLEDDGIIWGLRGRVYESEGDFEKAVAAFQKAVELRPAEAETHYRFGLALGRVGRRDEALAEIALSKTIQDAHATLLESFQDFNAATAAGVPRGETFEEATVALAEKCRILGMTRLADSLEKLLPDQKLDAATITSRAGN